MRILAVEDEALIALVLVEILAEGGHEVVGPVATVEQALALCEGAPPQLALRDLTLQGGGSGVDMARALHGRWGVPSIVASRQVCVARQARDVSLGCIRKPCAVETMLRRMEAGRAVMGSTPAASPPRGSKSSPPAGEPGGRTPATVEVPPGCPRAAPSRPRQGDARGDASHAGLNHAGPDPDGRHRAPGAAPHRGGGDGPAGARPAAGGVAPAAPAA